MEKKEKIQKSIANKEYSIAINDMIDLYKEDSFSSNWTKSINDIVDQEEIRINSLVIGKIGELEDRIYIGANTNVVLIYSLTGDYIDSIELEDGDEVKKLIISDIVRGQYIGNELIIQTANDSILFYGIRANGILHKLQYQVNYSTATITSVFSKEIDIDINPIFVGDSNGDVFKITYDSLKLSIKSKSIIPETDKIPNEMIADIIGSKKLINGKFGLIIGYKNGVLLLLDNDNKLISKFDIDKEIENIFLIEKTQKFVVTTDDFYIFHFSIINFTITNDWHLFTNTSTSKIIEDTVADSEREFYVLSEDNGTISCFNKSGNFFFSGDPSFEGTGGEYYLDKLILGSREGEIAMFNVISPEDSKTLKTSMLDCYYQLSMEKTGNDFYEFFNSEFESEERIDYFKEFLLNYLGEKSDNELGKKISILFDQKKYNTDIAEGLISKIICNSNLKDSFIITFKNHHISNEISNFHNQIEKRRNATNLIKKAKTFLKKDYLKYIELMNEIRIHKLDKAWVKKLFDDDDVVAIKYFHTTVGIKDNQILIGTRKGKVFLLNKITGQVIWDFKLDIGDGQITNIEIADICNNGFQEIIIGLENAQNSILILCVERDKFNSANNEIQLNWNADHFKNEHFKLYLTRCRVPGMDFNAVHKVHCFDFDFNGVQDIIISSENGRFEIFYFDNEKRDRIIPTTKTIDYNDDDVLVFELTRDNDQNIILYTGSASGNIQKHIYNGRKFVYANRSFTERDARITDIYVANFENETVVLFSSEDNFIYCLDNDLQYKWSFKTKGDVKSIGVTEFNNEILIMIISDDGYLYALDIYGNRKWDYPFFCPLDKLFVIKNEIIVADSDGDIYLLHLESSDEIITRMDSDLVNINIDYEGLLESMVNNVKIFAMRKLLLGVPGHDILLKIVSLTNDSNEFEELVRCESIKLLTNYLEGQNEFDEHFSKELISTLKDNSKEVRLESLKSFFKLIDKHKSNHVDIANTLIEVTEDEDIWVKEYLAGAINKLATTDNALLQAKWKVLLSLMVLNREEEWILNEASNSLLMFIYNISDLDFYLTILDQIFGNDFDRETIEKIKNKIIKYKTTRPSEINKQISNLFELYYEINFGNITNLKSVYNLFSEEYDKINSGKYEQDFLSKIQLVLNISEQINIDELINDQLLNNFSNYIKEPSCSLAEIIKNLDDYQKENNISDKIVYLNYAADSILFLSKSDLCNIDKKLIEIVIDKNLTELINKTSKLLLDNVYLDIELENRETTLNDYGVVDVNFNIINKGYKTVEDIEIIVRRNNQFEITEKIDDVGHLIKSQKKKVYFKIKPMTLGPIDIFLDITYKGSLKFAQEQIKIFVNAHNQTLWEEIDNPYTIGIPVINDNVFVGRESQIQEILSAIKKDPVFIMGHRRMGKTSLAKHIQRNYFSSKAYVPVFTTAELVIFSSMNDFLYSFSDQIADELILQNVFSFDEMGSYTDEIKKNGLTEFLMFFKKILSKIRFLNQTLILIIDEFPLINDNVINGKIDPQFLTNLRGFMQNFPIEFKMIYTGASSLQFIRSQHASNIMGVGKSVEVPFLNDNDVKLLISKPLSDKMKFESSAFEYFMELTSGQPFFVQMILSYLVDKLNRDKKTNFIFKEDLENGVSHFVNQGTHLQEDWNKDVISTRLKLDENEKKVIAVAYKQLIITSITDNWKRTKNGLNKTEIFNKIDSALKSHHKINYILFEEILSILVLNDDILRLNNNLYSIKIGLFMEWLISSMNFTFDKVLESVKDNLMIPIE